MASFPLSNDPGYNSCDQNSTPPSQEALLWEQNPTMYPIQAQEGGYSNVNEYGHRYIPNTNPQFGMYQGSNSNQMHAFPPHQHGNQAGGGSGGMNASPLLSPNQNQSFNHFRSQSHRTSSPYNSPLKYGPNPTTNQMQTFNSSQPHGYHQTVGEKHVVSSLPTPPTGNQAGHFCLPHQGIQPFGGMNGSQINYAQNQSRHANHFHTPTKGNHPLVVEMRAPSATLSIPKQGYAAANQILSPYSQNAFSMSGTTVSLSTKVVKNNQTPMEECMSDSEQSSSSSSSSINSGRRRRKAKKPKRKLTKEEKRKAKIKRIKNKIAAQKSRQKQKDRISWLEKENAELQLSISSMKTFTETYYHNLSHDLQSAGCPPNGIQIILNSAHNFFMAIKNLAAKYQEKK